MPKRKVVIEYDGEVELSEAAVRALQDWRAARAEIEKLKEVVEVSADKIKDELLAVDAEAGTVNGRVEIVYTKGEQTRLNVPKLRAQLGNEALAAYLETNPRREFREPPGGKP
jgi:hypothetical protein